MFRASGVVHSALSFTSTQLPWRELPVWVQLRACRSRIDSDAGHPGAGNGCKTTCQALFDPAANAECAGALFPRPVTAGASDF